jgi:phage tail sheath protein FI
VSADDMEVPGVYHRFVRPLGPPALTTGVPLFIGRAAASAAGGDEPWRLFRRWQDFAAWAGDAAPRQPGEGLPGGGQPAHGHLWDAVRGFFENGGTTCYVLPLGDQPPATSEDDGVVAQFEAALAQAERLHAADLVCAPDISLGPSGDAIIAMQTALLEHCARLGDRFAILDMARGSGPNKWSPVEEWAATVGASGAYYLPWLRVPSPGGPRLVPPCGHIAGVYASTDRRAGVYQAPANVRLEGVLGPEADLTDARQRELPGTVNCLRAFRGRGTLIWGARTLSADPNWRYVSVSRLFITVGRWARQNLASVVFEPNDRRLWARVERELSAYCAELFRRGALVGAKAEEAFFVQCDAATNPEEEREAGRLTVEVGLAPSLPNEFIIVRIVSEPGGVALALRSDQARPRDRGIVR